MGPRNCQNGLGAGVRSRILLRRELNREPTIVEIEDALFSGVYKIVTDEEVKDAYRRCDEVCLQISF